MSRLALVLAFSASLIYAQAQKSKPVAPATYVTPAEMTEELRTAPNQAAHLIDRPVRVIESGTHQIGVAIVKRTDADQNALIHDNIDEIYYVLEGGGTLVTGGKLTGEKHTGASPTIGPGWTGTGIEGGESRRVDPGQVIMIPAGTPHMFTKLDGTIRYLIYRVDPTDVTALK